MRGVLFRRTAALFILILLLTGMILLGAYSFLGRKAYVELEMDRLSSVSDTAVNLYFENGITANPKNFVHSLQFLAKTVDIKYYYFYYDAAGYIQALTNITEYDNEYIRAVQYEILNGKNVTSDSLILTDNTKAIAVGVPLYGDGAVVGGLLFVKDIQNIDAAFNEVSSALWLLVLCTVPTILVLGITGIQQVNKPIADMTKVAIAVAKGNYEVRADESAKGEMGIFARAMNRMSETLSHTIYQLDNEKRQLWSILSSFTDGVAALDDLGNLTHYNPALMKMFGAVEVQTPMDLVPDATVWDTFHAVFESGESQTMEYSLPGEKYLFITIVPVMSEENVCKGVVGLFKDVTEFQNLEKMRRDYVANISHELRTPLTAVRGLLEPLSDGMIKDEETRRKYYGIMLHEVERLSRLITDMLQLSRLESGTEYMDRKVFDINELIEDVFESYHQAAEKKGIRLELNLEETQQVLSDADRIEQVLVILLDNAMRYAGENGTVRIFTKQDDREIYVNVWDSGCGIAAGDIEHVFERFYKTDRSRREGGTGLGLSIASQIIDKLGETISVKSEQGHWTCFTFTLKKYVSNAIPLGPVDIDNAIVYAGGKEEDEKNETAHGQDAVYEVVKPEPQKKAEKKKDKKRHRIPFTKDRKQS